MRAARRCSLGLCLAAFLAACGGHEAASRNESTRTFAGPVVARVNGEPIALEEVRKVCGAAGLAPREALSRLVEERLLLQYASEQGFGQQPEVARQLNRARARALLLEAVERDERVDIAHRKEELERLLGELRRKTPVVLDEARVRELLANDELVGLGS